MAAKLEGELIEFAQKGSIKQLLAHGEQAELQLQPLSATFFNIMAMGYLIRGDYVSARFALRRAPLNAKDTAKETNKVTEITRGLWNHQDDKVLTMLASFDFLGLPKLLHQAVVVRTVQNFANAYTSATVAQVAKHLGVSEALVNSALPVVEGVKLEGKVLTISADIRQDALGPQAVQTLTKCAVLLRQPYE